METRTLVRWYSASYAWVWRLRPLGHPDLDSRAFFDNQFSLYFFIKYLRYSFRNVSCFSSENESKVGSSIWWTPRMSRRSSVSSYSKTGFYRPFQPRNSMLFSVRLGPRFRYLVGKIWMNRTKPFDWCVDPCPGCVNFIKIRFQFDEPAFGIGQ